MNVAPDPDDWLTDERRAEMVEDDLSAHPEYDRALHASVRSQLDAGMPVDEVVETSAASFIAVAKGHAHPVERAAAALWMLSRLSGWIRRPLGEPSQPPVTSADQPGAESSADQWRDTLWGAMEADEALIAEQHGRVRELMAATDLDDVFERFLAMVVKSSRGEFPHYAARAAAIAWYMKMIPVWMETPLADEN